MKFKRVSRKKFEKEMKVLSASAQMDIEEFIYSNEENIDHFEFAHIPHHRIFSIVLKDGLEKVWNTHRMH